MRLVTGLILVVGLFVIALSGCTREDIESPLKSGRSPQLTQLTSRDDVFEANPIFSPDGNWILFESEVSGNRDLWLIPATGGEPRQLTSHPGFDSAPYWSPDGDRLVFESDRSGFKNIWILDISDTEAEPVPMTAGAWDDGDPVWSPDGLMIVYESNRAKNRGSELWMSPAGGGEATRLTISGDGIYHRTADWSPDSAQLVFESNRVENLSALFTMDVSGGGPKRITPEYGYQGHPAWSPDGSEIAYESSLNGSMEIFTVSPGGGNPFQVTTSGGFWPRWAPNGDALVFCVFGDPEPNIWIVEVDW